MEDPGDPKPSPQPDAEPLPPIQEWGSLQIPNKPLQEQRKEKSEVPMPNHQRRQSGGGRKSSPLPDAELLQFFESETNNSEVNQIQIFEFLGTTPTNLTVGLVSALFLVGMTESGVTSEVSKAATIIQNVHALTRPPFKIYKNPMTASKLSSWNTKMRSNIEQGINADANC